ncbi:MAG: peptidoglycan DD-metalloendopeptidase family protein [Bacteroidota bacterium]
MLKKYQAGFNPVVSFNADTDKLLALDFTSANTELHTGILNDTLTFGHWVTEKLAVAPARYGIGGYGEHRTVYSASKVFDPSIAGEEPRRLHLGIDIWGKPHTAVMAPLNGIVHSFAFNNQLGDYGATIILSHNLEGVSFYTLYGHLSLSSIKNLQEGDRIDTGDLFAEFGIPAENGQWPPHLHFQLIDNIGDWSGDYPGVCRFSDREKWLANSPDPDIILQLNQYLK